MTFEIKTQDGRIMFRTNHPACIPDAETIAALKQSGYKCYQDGKVYPPRQQK